MDKKGFVNFQSNLNLCGLHREELFLSTITEAKVWLNFRLCILGRWEMQIILSYNDFNYTFSHWHWDVLWVSGLQIRDLRTSEESYKCTFSWGHTKRCFTDFTHNSPIKPGLHKIALVVDSEGSWPEVNSVVVDQTWFKYFDEAGRWQSEWTINNYQKQRVGGTQDMAPEDHRKRQNDIWILIVNNKEGDRGRNHGSQKWGESMETPSHEQSGCRAVHCGYMDYNPSKK